MNSEFRDKKGILEILWVLWNFTSLINYLSVISFFPVGASLLSHLFFTSSFKGCLCVTSNCSNSFYFSLIFVASSRLFKVVLICFSSWRRWILWHVAHGFHLLQSNKKASNLALESCIDPFYFFFGCKMLWGMS